MQLDDVYSIHHLISLTRKFLNTKLGLFLPNLALVALPSVAFTTPLVPRAQQVVREAQQPVSAGICVKICSAHLQPTFCLSTMILPGLRAHVGQRQLAKDSAEQSSARRKRLRKPRRWYRRFTVDIKHKSVYCMCIIRAITARHCRPLAGPSLHVFHGPLRLRERALFRPAEVPSHCRTRASGSVRLRRGMLPGLELRCLSRYTPSPTARPKSFSAIVHIRQQTSNESTHS